MLLLPGLCLDLWFGDTKILQTAGWANREGKGENEREREKKKRSDGGREEGKSNVLVRVNSWTWDNFN